MGIINPLQLPKAKRTVMLYSGSGEGKTGQLGELAKYGFELTGKKSLLYTMDLGGYETIRHLCEGDDSLIDVVETIGRPLPWEWVQCVSQGQIPLSDGTWTVPSHAQYWMIAYDGATGLGECLMRDLSEKAASGRNVTGQAPSIKFKEGSVTVANNSPAHFGLTQSRVAQAFQDSFKLPVELLVWTALAKNAEEETASGTVVGPQVAGRALTPNIPAMFMYTMRMVAIAPNPALGIQGSSRLYMDSYTEGVTAGNRGLANPRTPIGVSLPPFIEPASVVEGLKEIDKAREQARSIWAEQKARIRAKLGMV